MGLLSDAFLRGSIGGVLGAPVDTAGMLYNAAMMPVAVGAHKLGLISTDQLPDPAENLPGGSEWFGQKMQDAGLVSDRRSPIAELAAGFVSPSAPLKAAAAAVKAPVLAAGALSGARKLYGLLDTPEALQALRSASESIGVNHGPMTSNIVGKERGAAFDPRFDTRTKEQGKLADLTTEVAPRGSDIPTASLADFEGHPFITSMSDRTAARGLLTRHQ